MHLARHPGSRRLFTRALLLAALAVASLTLTHCRQVGDDLNGVRIGLFFASDCLAQCQATYNAQVKAEQDRHNLEVSNCQKLSGAAKSACLAAEDSRHNAAVAANQAQRITCQNNCHHQGTGSTGP